MEEDTHKFTEKHLARNVPVDFTGCCDRIKQSVFGKPKRGEQDSQRYRREYGGMFRALTDQDMSEDEVEELGQRLDNIRVRFLAVQKTLDVSVPAKPVHENLSRIQKWLNRALDELEDPDRDAAVTNYRRSEGGEGTALLPDRFAATESLAEKVVVVRDALERLADDLGPIVDFFEYKRGMCTKGQPSKYALLYSVFALGDLFEKQNTKGLKARVNHAAGNLDSRSRYLNRYTGQFLDFMLTFLWLIVPEQVSRRNEEAVADQIQNLAKKRKSDPELYMLLHGDVGVNDILAFMNRADAAK